MVGLKLLICVFLLTEPVFSKNRSVCSVQKWKNIKNNVSTSSILYGILRASAEYPRTGACNRELNRMLDGIHNRELWAIKGFYFHFDFFFLTFFFATKFDPFSIYCISHGLIGNATARICFGSEFFVRFSRWLSSSPKAECSDDIETI